MNAKMKHCMYPKLPNVDNTAYIQMLQGLIGCISCPHHMSVNIHSLMNKLYAYLNQ